MLSLLFCNICFKVLMLDPLIFLFINFPIYLFINLSIYLFIYLSIYQCIYLFIYLSIYLFIYLLFVNFGKCQEESTYTWQQKYTCTAMLPDNISYRRLIIQHFPLQGIRLWTAFRVARAQGTQRTKTYMWYIIISNAIFMIKRL